jgi:hypothetical protein
VAVACNSVCNCVIVTSCSSTLRCRAQPKIELVEAPAKTRKAEAKLNSFAIEHEHARAREERVLYV